MYYLQKKKNTDGVEDLGVNEIFIWGQEKYLKFDQFLCIL